MSDVTEAREWAQVLENSPPPMLDEGEISAVAALLRRLAATLDPKPHEQVAYDLALAMIGKIGTGRWAEERAAMIEVASAALAAERAKAWREAIDVASNVVPRHTECGLKIAAALRAAGEKQA